jgi:hypothetical protein
LSGLWTPSHQQRNLYGRLNALKKWPDFFIPVGVWPEALTTYHGLFLELKREGEKLKRDRDAKNPQG